MDREKFDRIFGSLYVVQDRDELFWLVNKVESLNPKAIIEIGVECGGSLRFWEQVLPVGGLLIGIDPASPQTKISWDWRNSDREIHLFEGRSQEPNIIFYTRRLLGKRTVDFLFIDAEHTEESVRRDFENYEPFVKSGGLVGFHDITGTDVKKFYNRLQGKKETMHKAMGIGVWWKP